MTLSVLKLQNNIPGVHCTVIIPLPYDSQMNDSVILIITAATA